jgi:6-phospho-3-hexuloisomerase
VDIGDASVQLCNRVCESLKYVDNDQAMRMIRAVLTSERIFIAGTGRSSLIGRFFAHRLVDLSLDAYVVGETITPAARVTDCIIAISGSGETTYTLNAVEMGKKVGAKIVAVTSYPESALGKMANIVIWIPGRILEKGNHQDYILRQMRGSSEDFSEGSGSFEISAAIFLESVTKALSQKIKRR